VLVASLRRSDSESASDSDTYGGARGREFAKKHRRRLQGASSRSASGLAGDLRFSTRQAGKVTTYNEEDGDDFSEEDTENMTPNYWVAAEDNSPAIDIVLNHRVGEGKGLFLHTLVLFKHALTIPLCRYRVSREERLRVLCQYIPLIIAYPC